MVARSSDSVALRHLAVEEEYERCVELQRLTWGRDFNELVAPSILKIAQKVGGVVAGAFADGGEMLGFVFGLSGIRDGRPTHWSHMLAVRREARGMGLGRRLKLFQRDYLVGLGILEMYWTYDPLVARNANLNLNRLGARPTEYVRDMYGVDTGSEEHSGLGTDRFVVRWDLSTGAAEGPHLPQEEVDERLLLNPGGAEGRARIRPFPREPRLFVEIPNDVNALKRVAPDDARRWRETSRASLMEALERGYAATGVVFGSETGAGRRCFYVLEAADGEASRDR